MLRCYYYSVFKEQIENFLELSKLDIKNVFIKIIFIVYGKKYKAKDVII